MKTEKVSIVTPCYNGEKYLERFLKSILNQSYGNIELIFINDGSTDQTEEIIKKYKEEVNTELTVTMARWKKVRRTSLAV